jgi:hypothetical protein
VRVPGTNVKSFLLGFATALVCMTGVAAYFWYLSPESLPAEWRQDNPNSRDYAPQLYRWKDAQGRVQLTDVPPRDRPYETIRVDPDTNVVPSAAPLPRRD